MAEVARRGSRPSKDNVDRRSVFHFFFHCPSPSHHALFFPFSFRSISRGLAPLSHRPHTHSQRTKRNLYVTIFYYRTDFQTDSAVTPQPACTNTPFPLSNETTSIVLKNSIIDPTSLLQFSVLSHDVPFINHHITLSLQFHCFFHLFRKFWNFSFDVDYFSSSYVVRWHIPHWNLFGVGWCSVDGHEHTRSFLFHFLSLNLNFAHASYVRVARRSKHQ